MRSLTPAVAVTLGLILLLAAVTGLYGLTGKGIQSWDEGVYYDEARFCALSARAVIMGAVAKLQPAAGRPGFAELKQQVIGIPPRMGRPLNCLLNTAGLLLVGNHQWAPALLSALAGVGCVLVLFILARRLFDDPTALLAALLLTLSPYFLPYRRLGMCEAPATLLALLTLLVLVRLWQNPAFGRWAWQSLGLGLLCGLTFGANTRTLTLLPVVLLWQAYSVSRRPGEDRGEAGGSSPSRLRGALSAGVLVLAGFGLMIALYQLPYLLVAPLQAQVGLELTSYLAQLRHFAVTQQAMGGVGLPLAYGGAGLFLGFYEGPVVLLLLLGVLYCLRRPAAERWLLLSLLILPLLQTARLIPYARYISWLLPVLMLLAAVGLRQLALALGRQGAPPVARRVALAHLCLVAVVVLWSVPRTLAVMGAVSQMPAALQGAQTLGVQQVVTSNRSLAYACAPLYDLEQLHQLPSAPAQASQVLQAAINKGLTVVILDPQQHVEEAILMPVEDFEASAAAQIRRQCTPLWQAPHLRGLFAFLCFEHNRDIRATWRVHQTYRQTSTTLAVYDATPALQALQNPSPLAD